MLASDWNYYGANPNKVKRADETTPTEEAIPGKVQVALRILAKILMQDLRLELLLKRRGQEGETCRPGHRH